MALGESTTATEEVYKAAMASKSLDAFYSRLVYAVKKANVAAIPGVGGPASELVPEPKRAGAAAAPGTSAKPASDTDIYDDI